MREHHRELIGELTRVGLTPRLSQTHGNHTRVEWETGGKVYHIVTATSPSDRRATLNARARIRRQLRDQGFFRPTVVAPEGAPNLVHPTPTLEERVTQLELDVVTLLDMVGTNEQEVAPAPTAFFDAEKKPTKSRLLFFIPCDSWSSSKEIARRSGKSSNAVAVALHSLKKKGAVEHDEKNHRYRKKIECLL
jgi:hypothetical protein